MKEAVEEAFAAGLVKVVFATETLALGINMPARSVVIEKLSKFTGEHHEFLTPGEYTQLTGRAGRRGIDDVGYAVVLLEPVRAVRAGRRARVAAHRRAALVVPPDVQHGGQPRAAVLAARQARHLLNLSFAQFHADRDVVALERQLERTREQLARQQRRGSQRLRRRRGVPRGSSSVATPSAAAQGAPRIDRALDALRPGDVVWRRARRRARSSC